MNKLVQELVQIAYMAGIEIDNKQINVIDRGCPHNAEGLPKGNMGIYMFKYNNEYLKIGKVGSKSNARFLSQHYNPNSSKSNLAKTIINSEHFYKYNLNNENVGEWIKSNVHRVDILIDENLGIFVLNLFESFLHCKYKPKYEGYSSQKSI